MKLHTDSASMGVQEVNADIQKRLKRAEGQVRAIIRMTDQDVPCMEILMQISAVRSALRQAGLSILKRHVKNCVTDAIIAEDESGESLIDEMIRGIDRYGL